MVSKLSEIYSGLFIPDSDYDFLLIPDPEVKKAQDPGSGSATLPVALCAMLFNREWKILIYFKVMLTLWGSSAETFTGEGCPVVSVKGARVSDFNGITLR
jgi:hypothetical protein